MLFKCELMLLKSQINTNTNKMDFCFLQNVKNTHVRTGSHSSQNTVTYSFSKHFFILRKKPVFLSGGPIPFSRRVG